MRTYTHNPDRELSRTLGTRQLVAYYVSSLVGVGLLATPLLTARIAGPACLIAWGMLVLLSYPFAHLFARIAMTHPHSGGIASFVQHVLGSRTGNVVGLMLVVALVALTTAMGMVTGEYLQVLLGLSESTLVPLGFAAIVVSVLTNLMGLRLGSKVQAAGLLALITTLIALLSLSAPHAQPENLTPALARDGVLPRRLSTLSRRTATPHRALLALAGGCAVVPGSRP
jgi:amino acid efflux transporter